jgi:hypothetical protein
MTDDRRQMTVETTFNEKLLQMLHGSGCYTGHVSRFLEKRPVKHLAAGGRYKYKSGG